jgi:hypothetical protein
VLVTGAAAALPILVATVRAVADGWIPLGDNAYTAVNALDVFSAHPPLVGQWSSGTTGVLEEPAYSPGPMLFWLLALPARLSEPSALVVTVGLVNVASVIAVVGLAHRRGGRPLMFAAGIAIPLMVASLAGEVVADVWNSSAPLLPFTLLLFLVWSVGCGQYRLLPLTALVASFVAQSHLTFVPATLGAVAVGLGGLAASRRVSRPWIVAAVAVTLVCWSAPLVDEGRESPGNLALLARAATADSPTAGAAVGWHAVVAAVGVVPWWLEDPQPVPERADDLKATPSAVSIGSAVLVLVWLAGVTVAGVRRRRSDVLVAGALGLVLCAALFGVAASTPTETFDTLGYTLRWASPAGMWVWLALGWSLARLLVLPRPGRRLRPWAAPAAGALALIAAIGVVVALTAEPRPDPYREMRRIAERLAGGLPSEGTVRVDASVTRETLFLGFLFHAGIVHELRHDGRDVVSPSIAVGLGDHYDRGEHDWRLVVDVDEREVKGGRTIARRPARDPFVRGAPLERMVTVTLHPAGAGR